MIVEYKKPRQIKPKSNQYNLLTDSSFTMSISFKIGKDSPKDEKWGILGIPGKNFGISYDTEVETFVFEYWTQKSENEFKFHCHKDYGMSRKDLENGVTITIVYDSNKLKFKLYQDFDLIDVIDVENGFLRDYYKDSIYIGCHSPSAMLEKHRCYTELDISHFSVFNTVMDMDILSKFHFDKNTLMDEDQKKLICYFDFSNNPATDVIYDESGFENNLEAVDMDDFKKMVDFNETREKLDKVGCGFCLAKWTQVTMHLNNGTTHSCHHPEPHKVELEELNRNYTALHNSNVKKQARKEMLEGKRPTECQYCWNVEDNSNSFSDRIFKSAEPWSEPHFEEITKSHWRDDYNPKYVEVNFSNTCNFKCAYCGPVYSSKWMDEINEHGAYMLSHEYNGLRRLEETDTKPYKHSEENPYVESFWKWWPELYNTLDTFRITGGEPLLSKDTWGVLDYIINSEEPNRELKLSINSNLGVTDDLINKLIEKLEIIIEENRAKEVIIFTSCDAYGKQAEYVRYGLDFDKLFKNIDKILKKLPKVTVVIMSTFNIFSVFSYEKLIKKVRNLKIKHFNTERFWNSALILDTSYLRHPSFLSFRLLKGFVDVEYFNRWEKYMKFNTTYRSLNFFEQQTIDDVGFSTKEIEKITRMKDIFISDYATDEEAFRQHKKDFLKFIREYEVRRGVVCEEFYPELTEFIKSIENEN
jgi:hypothetical protein